MSYSGKYLPGPKYIGDRNNCYYRSLWERQVMRWCDLNSGVVSWSSEENIVPYKCVTDGKIHHYYVDFMIEFNNGERYLVEIKPEIQTKPPVKRQKLTRKYLTEVMTYGKNLSKWTYCKSYAEARGMKFAIWTEAILKKLGIQV